MRNFLQDLRFGWRLNVKSPVYMLVAVLTLGLGVGANTAIFSVLKATLLRPLPFPHPQQVAGLEWNWSQGGMSQGLTPRVLHFIQRRATAFSQFGEMSYANCNMVYGRQRFFIGGARASAGYFPALGIRPEAGRNFTELEDQPGGPEAMLLSDRLWRGRLGGNRGILGHEIECNGRGYTVVGIMPAGAAPGEERMAFWIPLRLAAVKDIGWDFGAVARLKPGWPLAQANRQMAALTRQYFQKYRPQRRVSPREGVRLAGYREYAYGDKRSMLMTLLDAVALVLLIACANLAGLLLARAAQRAPEIALRSALGASRGRLLRQFLSESLWLGLGGGAVSVLLASGGIALIRDFYPAGGGSIPALRLDWPLLGFSFGLALAAALAAALAPAWATTRAALASSLQPAGWHAVGSGRQRGRRALVIAQIAIAVSLLAGAGLMLREFLRLAGTPLGFDPQPLQVVRLPLMGPRYRTAAATWQFDGQVLRGIKQLPGVESAAAASAAPLSWGLNVGLPEVNGKPCRPEHMLLIRAVSPEYFKTLGVRLVAGSMFAAGAARPVAVVNQALARRCWRGASPLGSQVWAGKNLGPDYADEARAVIGVSADIREISPGSPPQPTMYIPLWQVPAKINPFMYRAFPAAIVARSRRPLPAAAVNRIVAEAAPEQTIAAVEPLTRLLNRRMTGQRFMLLLLGIFAGLALLLTAIGFYGLLQFEISRRTREIGVRLALGASPRQVRATVLRQAASLAGYGLMAGAAGMWFATHLLAGTMGRASAGAPWGVWAGVPGLVLAVALAAAWMPARRASRTDPLTALRYE